MGQYYTVVCKDLKETMHPHDFGVYAKGREILSSPLFGKALMYVLMWSSSLGNSGDVSLYNGTEPIHMGRWYGKRVKIVGEYDKSTDYEKSDHFVNISKNIILEMGACGVLSSFELLHLMDTYSGDYNKRFRQKLHIFHTYAKKAEEDNS